MDGGATETVLVREIQWDHLGKEIIHLDFARVSAGESIETEVRLDLRGTAPGVAEGGVLEQLIHSIDVTCRADAIPDNIKVDVSDLHLGKAIHVQELKLPEGVTVKADPEALVVHVTTKVAEADRPPRPPRAPSPRSSSPSARRRRSDRPATGSGGGLGHVQTGRRARQPRAASTTGPGTTSASRSSTGSPRAGRGRGSRGSSRGCSPRSRSTSAASCC